MSFEVQKMCGNLSGKNNIELEAVAKVDYNTDIRKEKINKMKSEEMKKCTVENGKEAPSVDAWLKEAKALQGAGKNGMFLVHNGVVRETAKAKVRQGERDTKPVNGMNFSYDRLKVEAIMSETYKMEGIFHIRVWLNEGLLQVGDDIMYVLIGGDIRPHVVDALQYLVGRIKNECVVETELYE